MKLKMFTTFLNPYFAVLFACSYSQRLALFSMCNPIEINGTTVVITTIQNQAPIFLELSLMPFAENQVVLDN